MPWWANLTPKTIPVTTTAPTIKIVLDVWDLYGALTVVHGPAGTAVQGGRAGMAGMAGIVAGMAGLSTDAGGVDGGGVATVVGVGA
jgi:hypothetical protein